MTTIPPMVCARVDGIPGLAANGRTGQQSKMGDQSRQLGQLSIDRSSSTAQSISITNPSINMLEASGNGRSPLVQAEVVLQAFSFGPFRIVPHARLMERDGSPMPLRSRAFDFVAPVGCAASPYIQHLYRRGDLSCQRINICSGRREV
jgi:hypothetical protein